MVASGPTAGGKESTLNGLWALDATDLSLDHVVPSWRKTRLTQVSGKIEREGAQAALLYSCFHTLIALKSHLCSLTLCLSNLNWHL